MKIFCDMDNVLVSQTSHEGFDKMPWMHDGRALWDAIKGRKPTILSQLREPRYGQTAHEKLAWIQRELGRDVPFIFSCDSIGKSPFSGPGYVLIDDAAKHGGAWTSGGGVFVHHKSTPITLIVLRQIGVL